MLEKEKEMIREQAERYIDRSGEYTAPYERDKIIANWIGKEAAARGLLEDFERRAGAVKGRDILEVGFGNGMQSVVFAEAGARMSGLEVNDVLLSLARENAARRGVHVEFALYDGIHMPAADGSFDYVYATSVLEHVSYPGEVLKEISRVLRNGGKCYLSFPNRWAPRETHTGFWLVGYLPRRIAEILLKFFGSNAVEELNMHFLSFFALRRLISGTDLVILFEKGNGWRGFLKNLLARLGLHHSALLKTVMVVLEKRAHS